jgi:hypothetical protein
MDDLLAKRPEQNPGEPPLPTTSTAFATLFKTGQRTKRSVGYPSVFWPTGSTFARIAFTTTNWRRITGKAIIGIK